jgi:hypothetical protein
MARSSKVTPTLEPNISSDDNEDNEEEDDDFASLIEKNEMFFHAIRKNKIACSYFYKILAISTESNKIMRSMIIPSLKCKVIPVITRRDHGSKRSSRRRTN